MRFEDIHEYMWIKYNDDYWCVVHIGDDVCYLENDMNNTSLTRSAFNQHHIEQVQSPRFHLYEKVIYIGRANEELRNKIVTVTILKMLTLTHFHILLNLMKVTNGQPHLNCKKSTTKESLMRYRIVNYVSNWRDIVVYETREISFETEEYDDGYLVLEDENSQLLHVNLLMFNEDKSVDFDVYDNIVIDNVINFSVWLSQQDLPVLTKETAFDEILKQVEIYNSK